MKVSFFGARPMGFSTMEEMELLEDFRPEVLVQRFCYHEGHEVRED